MSKTTNTTESLDELIERRVNEAATKTKSPDSVVQIAWLAQGIDIWHKSNGKMGNSPEDAQRYIISSVTRLLQQEVLRGRVEVLNRLLKEAEYAEKDLESGGILVFECVPTEEIRNILADLNTLLGGENDE